MKAFTYGEAMPTVKLPSGKDVQLDRIPEGAGDSDVMREILRLGAATIDDFYPRPNIGAAQDRAVQAVADELNPLERQLVGTRETLRTAAGRIASLFGGDEYAAEQERNRELTKHVTGPEATVGRILPMFAGARTPGGYIPQATTGAITGALTGETPEGGAMLGAAGGAGGTLLGNLLGRGANAIRGNWATRAVSGTDDAANALRSFQDEGGRMYPSQASTSETLKLVDKNAAQNFLLGSAYRRISAANTKLLTEAGAKAAGVESSTLGPTALRQIDDVISSEFRSVADMIEGGIPLHPGISDDIASLLRKGDIKPHAEALATGKLTGRQYMDIRSKLLGITRGSSDKVKQAWDVIEDLDDSVQEVAPAAFKARYAMARERFKNLLTLEKYRRGVSGGQINARTMDAAAEEIFGKQYTRDLPTLLPETKRFHTILRAMADPRMDPLTGGSQTGANLSSLLTAGGLGGITAANPILAAMLAGGAYAGTPALLAARAAPGFGQAGGQLGRVTPNILDSQ